MLSRVNLIEILAFESRKTLDRILFAALKIGEQSHKRASDLAVGLDLSDLRLDDIPNPFFPRKEFGLKFVRSVQPMVECFPSGVVLRIAKIEKPRCGGRR